MDARRAGKGYAKNGRAAEEKFLRRRSRHGPGLEDGHPFRKQPEITHDFTAIKHGGHAAALIRGSQTADAILIFKAFIGVEMPVRQISRSYGINMCVVGKQTRPCSQPAQSVAHAVDFRSIPELVHLCDNTTDNGLFMTAC